MPWLSVNHTRLAAPSAVPRPLFALDVHRAEIPGQPGANSTIRSGSLRIDFRLYQATMNAERAETALDCRCHAHTRHRRRRHARESAVHGKDGAHKNSIRTRDDAKADGDAGP